MARAYSEDLRVRLVRLVESGTSAPPSGGAGELHLLCTAKNGDTTTLDVGASQIDVQYGASHYHNGTVVSQTDDDIMAVAAGRTGLKVPDDAICQSR